MIESRIRELHIAKYGATEDVLDYVRVLENLKPVPDSEQGEDHHMLARSVFSEYANLKTHPWNRLRVSRGIHLGLTKIQGWFDGRLRIAALMMGGRTAEAQFEQSSRLGRSGIGGKVTSIAKTLACRENIKKARDVRTPEQLRENGRKQGERLRDHGLGIFALTPEQRGERIKKALASLTAEDRRNNAKMGGMTKTAAQTIARRENMKKAAHTRHHVNRLGGFNLDCKFRFQII